MKAILMDLPQTATELIDSARAFGTIITLNRDGSPQVTLVWIEVLDGKLSFNTSMHRQKYRNLVRDPRVTVSVQNPDNPPQYAAFHGTAILTEDGADAQIDRLANKYMGVAAYPSREPGERRIRIDVDIQRIVGSGPWVESQT